jgi:hypothetical protein
MRTGLNFFILTLTLFLLSCDANNIGLKDDTEYRELEFEALEDLTNQYLRQVHLSHLKDYENMMSEINNEKPPVFNFKDLPVYISDALVPIAQIEEDEKWMFEDRYKDNKNKQLFQKIINSKQFKTLFYREFNKSDMILDEPFKQVYETPPNLKKDQEYVILNFSRVCFDKKREKGVVVIHYTHGYDNGKNSGNHGVYMIEKKVDGWIYIQPK